MNERLKKLLKKNIKPKNTIKTQNYHCYHFQHNKNYKIILREKKSSKT